MAAEEVQEMSYITEKEGSYPKEVNKGRKAAQQRSSQTNQVPGRPPKKGWGKSKSLTQTLALPNAAPSAHQIENCRAIRGDEKNTTKICLLLTRKNSTRCHKVGRRCVGKIKTQRKKFDIIRSDPAAIAKRQSVNYHQRPLSIPIMGDLSWKFSRNPKERRVKKHWGGF